MIPVKGYAAQNAKAPLTPYSFERREVGKNDVLIDIHYCGICHSDIHQIKDEWGGSLFPMVPGHEIIGVVSQTGSSVSKFKVGDRVGVGCFVDSCRQCDNCHEGMEQFCDGGMTLTYNNRDRKTGDLVQGGYSTKIVVDENYVLRIPENLPMDAAAPALCRNNALFTLKTLEYRPRQKSGDSRLGWIGTYGRQTGSCHGG